MGNFGSITASVLMMASPILIAAMGGLISERAGVVNIALEGLMAFGAFTAATVHFFLEGSFGLWSLVVALIAASLSGGIVVLLHAFPSVILNANQIISGTGINLLANGVTIFLAGLIFHQERTKPFVLGMTPVGGLYPTAYIALLVVLATWYFLYTRRIGIRLRACGENPAAAQAAGIDVKKTRFAAIIVSGLLAGLAGACMVLTQTIEYKVNMINGAGFIALAAVSFGRWKPHGVGLASLLFGVAVSLSIVIVNFKLVQFLPSEFFNMLPYVITLVTLVVFSGKEYAPQAVGKPFENAAS